MICSVEELVSRLLDETELYVEMGAMPGGAQRQANLDALISKARSYDETGSFGLYGFLQYMDDARSIDEIENLTGIDFFHALPDDVEDAVEASLNQKVWE